MLSDSDYRLLQPQERLRATIAAMARGDSAEYDRLADTCQHKHYTMADAAYSMPLRGLAAMSAMHQLLIHRLMSGYLMALYVMDGVERAAETDPMRLEDRGYQVACEMLDTSIACLKARRDGWDEFCQRAKLDAKEMAAMLQVGIENDRYLAAIECLMLRDETPADIEVRDQYVATLMDAWEEMADV